MVYPSIHRRLYLASATDLTKNIQEGDRGSDLLVGKIFNGANRGVKPVFVIFCTVEVHCVVCYVFVCLKMNSIPDLS